MSLRYRAASARLWHQGRVRGCHTAWICPPERGACLGRVLCLAGGDAGGTAQVLEAEVPPPTRPHPPMRDGSWWINSQPPPLGGQEPPRAPVREPQLINTPSVGLSSHHLSLSFPHWLPRVTSQRNSLHPDPCFRFAFREFKESRRIRYI